jgi:hypothetical protein
MNQILSAILNSFSFILPGIARILPSLLYEILTIPGLLRKCKMGFCKQFALPAK